jgi:ribosomal protein S27AE
MNTQDERDLADLWELLQSVRAPAVCPMCGGAYGSPKVNEDDPNADSYLGNGGVTVSRPVCVKCGYVAGGVNHGA